MSGSRSEKLTLFDNDSADALTATDKIIEGARVNRDAWAEGAVAYA